MIGVTITGADDHVGTVGLERMSVHYPWVEWAILMSLSRMGTPRYPSASWLGDLARRAERVKLAAHVCGRLAREPQVAAMFIAMGGFRRMQINGYDPGTSADWSRALRGCIPPVRTRPILEVRSEDTLAEVLDDAERLNADVLFDPSGGRGIETRNWPRITPPPGVRIGYAGGIGPHNIESVIDAILATGATDFWVDMESGVRDEQDRFSWNRVTEVLTKVRDINERLR